LDPASALHSRKDAAKAKERLISIRSTALGLLAHFLLSHCQETPFGLAQTLHSFSRNFFQQWIDFFRDEFRCAHALNALNCLATLAQETSQPGRVSKSE
jgi:hypothetical protein